MTALCCWFYPCCHHKLTKREYKIVVVIVITIFTNCDQNYMEKLLTGLKEILLHYYQHKSFSIFFHTFQTTLFKIYETFRNLPLPPSTMLRMRANTWPFLINAKDWGFIFTDIINHSISTNFEHDCRWVCYQILFYTILYIIPNIIIFF